MKNKFIVSLGLFLASAPMLALAQVSTSGSTSVNCNVGTGGTLGGLLCKIGELLNAIIPVLIALGVVYFVWGVITYVVGGDEEAKKKGRDKMIYGISGLVVIIGLWGLVSMVRNTFRLDNSTNIQLPTIPVVPR